jgi:hypothetical protein
VAEPDIAKIAASLTKAQRGFLDGRHNDEGNPWPFISMSQRAGGAKSRMQAGLFQIGLYDRHHCLTPLGLAVRNHLQRAGK